MENEARRPELEELEEVDEEEETTLLRVRKSTTAKYDSKVTETFTIIPGMNEKLISETEGQAIQSTLTVNGAHKEESTLVNNEKKEKPNGVLENQAKNDLVFFDKVEGVGHGKMELLSHSHKASEEIESADIDLINEEAEYHVETVLQKQNTHDLYCPNCNSCITGRVILRKRKRTIIQISEEEVKRNKTENPPVQASDDQVHPHHHIGAEDQDVDRDSGPDLFRCLSCFSFFIPAGDGFRLFWKSGDKSSKENVQDERIPRRKKNWFTSIFASHNQYTVIEQDVPRASEPLLETVEDNGTLECDDKILLSPRHEHSTKGLVVMYRSGSEPQQITEKIDAKMEQHDVVAGYHLKEPIISNDHFEVVSGYHLKEPIRSKEQLEVFTGYHLKEPIISNDQFEEVSGYHLKEPIRSTEQLEVFAGYHLKEPIICDDQFEEVSGYHLKEPIRSREQLEGFAGYHLKEPIISKDQFEEVSGYHLKEPIRSKEQLEVFAGYHLKEPIISDDQFEEVSGYHLKEPIRTKEQLEVFAGYHLKEPIISDDQFEVVSGYHLKEPIISNDQFEVASGYHLKEPIRSKEQLEAFAGYHLKEPIRGNEEVDEEPAQDAISVSRKGGSNLVIFSNNGSTTIETSEEGQILIQTAQKGSTGKETVITIDSHPASEIIQGIVIPAETAIRTQTDTLTDIPVQEQTGDVRRNSKIEVIKSIVYGGLAELITSLSVVSSAAGGDATTLNILALGMANLIGGFFVICHNLWELRCEQTDQVTDQRDRYQELLGQRQNFKLHAIVCVLSYLVFGLTPIVAYGFSFRQSEERELKLVVAGAVSLVCIIALSIGKAYVCRPPKAYVKTIVNFVILGFMASGISYAVGVLVKRFLERLGLFQSTSVSDMILNRVTSEDSTWASY